MASQSAGTGGDGNQVHPLCSPVPSVRGKADYPSTLRREYLDRMLFWTTADLENKLLDFRTYFNNQRTHSSLEGRTPDTPVSRPIANLRSFRWQPLVTYIRHQWLRNFPKTLDRCVSGQPWGNLQLNHLVFAFLWLRASRIRSFLFHPLSIRQRPCYSAKVPS